MSTNDRKNTNKPGDKSATGAPKPQRKPKAESAKPLVKSEKQKAESRKPKAVRIASGIQENKSETATALLSTSENKQLRKIENPKRRSPLEHLKKINTGEKSEIMEVHHHPQLEHKPKSIKEYLLEGFMIFIAVMMGFIAENIRETIDNNEHARQLTSQLVQDLKADTAKLNDAYRHETRILKTNDTLFALLQQPFAKVDVQKLQKLAANSHSLWPFHASEGAMGAIKNELHLKQFANSKIMGYISRYEGHIELLHTVQDITLQYQRNFLDPFLFQHFTPANLQAAFDHSHVPDAQMRNLAPQDLTQLAAEVVLIRINNNELLTDNRYLMNDAVSLLNYVKKRYSPEEE